MDANGRPIVIGRHMTLSDNGAPGSWQNPADALVWEVVFAEPGCYGLTGLTQSARHSAAWAGDRVVELAFGNETHEFPKECLHWSRGMKTSTIIMNCGMIP